jgi:ribosomal-protein-alanine N-acetyltransferase
MVKIRRFDPNKDLLEIANMTNTILGEEYKLSMFTNVHEAWPDGFLLAESMGSNIGAIISIINEPEIARILILVVDKSNRRRGIANKLLNAFIQRATLRGITRLTLEVRMSNKEAIQFYLKNRFKIISTISAYYKDGEGAYVMERPI